MRHILAVLTTFLLLSAVPLAALMRRVKREQ